MQGYRLKLKNVYCTRECYQTYRKQNANENRQRPDRQDLALKTSKTALNLKKAFSPDCSCSGNGNCDPYTGCKCFAGFSGENCEIPKDKCT